MGKCKCRSFLPQVAFGENEVSEELWLSRQSPRPSGSTLRASVILEPVIYSQGAPRCLRHLGSELRRGEPRLAGLRAEFLILPCRQGNLNFA